MGSLLVILLPVSIWIGSIVFQITRDKFNKRTKRLIIVGSLVVLWMFLGTPMLKRETSLMEDNTNIVHTPSFEQSFTQ